MKNSKTSKSRWNISVPYFELEFDFLPFTAIIRSSPSKNMNTKQEVCVWWWKEFCLKLRSYSEIISTKIRISWVRYNEEITLKLWKGSVVCVNWYYLSLLLPFSPDLCNKEFGFHLFANGKMIANLAQEPMWFFFDENRSLCLYLS